MCVLRLEFSVVTSRRKLNGYSVFVQDVNAVMNKRRPTYVL